MPMASQMQTPLTLRQIEDRLDYEENQRRLARNYSNSDFNLLHSDHREESLFEMAQRLLGASGWRRVQTQTDKVNWQRDGF